MVLKFLILGFIFSLIQADSKGPVELPRFSSFETGVLAAEKCQSKKPEGSEKSNDSESKKSEPSGPSCEQKIVAELEQYVDNLGVHFRNNISSVFENSKVYDKICTEYSTQKKNLKECPATKNIKKFGIITFLEISCGSKKKLITENFDCFSDMDKKFLSPCRQVCISKNYQGMDKVFERNETSNCEVSTCISRCINDQVQECNADSGFKNFYNELAGAQMLLGIEHILGSGSPETFELIQSSRLPVTCRRLVWRGVLAAHIIRETGGYNKNHVAPF